MMPHSRPEPPAASWARRVLAGVVAVTMGAALFTLGSRTRSSPEVRAIPPEGSGAPGVGTDGAAGGSRRFDPGPPPPPAIEAAARSVVYQGNIAGLEAIQLAGAATARFSGELIDSTGKSRGRGGLTATGPALDIAGPSLGIALTGELRLAGAGATFVNPAPRFEVLSVSSTGNVRVSAASVAFTPADAPAPVTLAGPVTLVRAGNSGIKIEADGDLQWPNAPSALRLVSPGRGRSTLSWAGDGVVRADGGEHRATHLGVKAASIDATIERAGGGWRVGGNGAFLQVYRDGLPVLPAVGRVRVKSGPGSVPRGGTGGFTWAPENDGRTDMTITRIRPDNAEAAWVSLGLLDLPAMCGGERCPARGGDTTGLRRGKPINAVIIPGTGDERDIRFSVPANAALGRHQLVLVVEGNFEPIRVVVEFDVVDPPPTTARP